jgi:plasmid stability protein
MAQLVVRNIEADVKKKLQRRAIRHGRSMEEEVRDILRNAVKEEGRRGAGGLGSEIAALFGGIGLDTSRNCAATRPNPRPLPATFD